MANGFLPTSPASKSWSNYWSVSIQYNRWNIATRFTAPLFNAELTEIGFWGYGWYGPAGRLALFTHDAVNNCPESMVADSETPRIDFTSTGWPVFQKFSYVYPGTRPQFNAGETYWIVLALESTGQRLDITVNSNAGANTSYIYYKTATNFLTGDAWHSHTDYGVDVDFFGVYYVLPTILVSEPLVAISSLVSTGLLIDKITAPALTSEGSLSGDLFWGKFISVDPLASQSNLSASLKMGIPAEMPGQSVLAGPPLLSLKTSDLLAIGSMSVSDAICIKDPEAQVTYECILSNDDEDITLPIESFQGYFRTNESSYLGVVVPTVDYEDQVNDAIAAGSCTLSVYMIKTYNTGNIVRELVQTVDIDETGVRIDEGATNQSMTLSGYRQDTRTPKVSVLGSSFKKSTQYSSDGIKYSYQCRPDLFLRAGDTVRIDGKEFTADSIRWEVNVERGQMTVLPV